MPSSKKQVPSTRADVHLVLLEGEITSAPTESVLKTGEVSRSFDVTSVTATGRYSVPVVSMGRSALPSVGSRVIVSGIVRRRFFRTGAGTTSRTEVLASRIVRASRGADIVRLRDAARAEISGLDVS